MVSRSPDPDPDSDAAEIAEVGRHFQNGLTGVMPGIVPPEAPALAGR